jgi:YhgE/Pip-like protein
MNKRSVEAMAFVKQKMLWVGILVVLVVLAVFGVAMMGSILSAKPKDLPVALVMLDQRKELPSGESLAIGEMIKAKLVANTQLPIHWKVVGSEAEALEGMNQQDYYGALLLPADLSAGLLSLQTSTPKPAVVQIMVNEGMNTQATTVVKQVLQQATKEISLGLSEQVLGLLGKQVEQIPVRSALTLLIPIQIQEQVFHSVGSNNANGNAPGMLTQIIWIGSLVTSMFMFLTKQKAFALGARKRGVIVSQAIAGITISAIVSGFLVWMSSAWYGMDFANIGDTWLILWLIGSAFFLLQSTLLNWIGFPAMGILVLLMFFSMPLLNMAPEFLPQSTQDWLYSWTPLRYAASGLRNVMYFDGVQPSTPSVMILWLIAGFFLIALLGSALKKVKQSHPEATVIKVDAVS